MELYPDSIKLKRLPGIENRFTEGACNADKKLEKMVKLLLEYPDKTIKQ